MVEWLQLVDTQFIACLDIWHPDLLHEIPIDVKHILFIEDVEEEVKNVFWETDMQQLHSLEEVTSCGVTIEVQLRIHESPFQFVDVSVVDAKGPDAFLNLFLTSLRKGIVAD